MSATADRIFCSAHSAGISVYSLARPAAPAFLGHVSSNSPTQRPYSAPVPMKAIAGAGTDRLWLYATMGRATLSVFDVTAQDPADAVELATLQLPVAFVFGVAVAAVGERHFVYVSYSNSTNRQVPNQAIRPADGSILTDFSGFTGVVARQRAPHRSAS